MWWEFPIFASSRTNKRHHHHHIFGHLVTYVTEDWPKTRNVAISQRFGMLTRYAPWWPSDQSDQLTNKPVIKTCDQSDRMWPYICSHSLCNKNLYHSWSQSTPSSIFCMWPNVTTCDHSLSNFPPRTFFQNTFTNFIFIFFMTCLFFINFF